MAKHTLTLYYSVQNGGDGSAYPLFMSSEKLARYDQENMDEGWGEPCDGSITLESDSPIVVKEEIETPESYLVTLISQAYDEDDQKAISKFVKEFFPEGKPKFTVEVNEKPTRGYLYNDVLVDGVKVGRVFTSTKDSGKALEKRLNS